MTTTKRVLIALAVTLVAGMLYQWGHTDGHEARTAGLIGESFAAQSPSQYSPVLARDRDFYAPNSEDLGPDEMRLIACGTGMPTARPKQAASCWLLELGNGDKFLFDVGTGSNERIAALQIPYNYLDKVFLSHLHTDHFGDLDALFIGGALSGRQKPLRVWGPNGETPERGTAYALDHLSKALTWDVDGRAGLTDPRGYHFEVHEFDYTAVNEVIYQDNGVTIRSIPAIHALDGSVSFILEWNGLKFAFSSDTYPNKWWMEHTKNADLAIHECFAPPSIMVGKQRFPVQDALNVATQVHTSPAMFGKVMSEITPRMAVGYHVFNDFDTQPQIVEEVRSTYDGPFELAVDYMVFNVTKDEVRVRMAAIDEDIWPLPSIYPPKAADPSQRVGFTDFLIQGRDVFKEVIDQYYSETNEMFGTNFEPPQ